VLIAKMLAREFDDEGFDEEATVADVQENIPRYIGENDGIGTLDSVL
jgi:hypothetical protein